MLRRSSPIKPTTAQNSPRLFVTRYTICTHPRCSRRENELRAEMLRQIRRMDLDVALGEALTLCSGDCQAGPYVGLPQLGLFYGGVRPQDAAVMLEETTLAGRLIFERLLIQPTTVTDSRLVFERRHGVLVAMEADACLLELVSYLFDFNARESCGKCFPCRLGTHRLHWLLHRLMTPGTGPAHLRELRELAAAMARDSYCEFADKVTAALRLGLELGGEVFERHLTGGCPVDEIHLLGFRPEQR